MLLPKALRQVGVLPQCQQALLFGSSPALHRWLHPGGCIQQSEADETAEKIVEKGTKQMMGSDEGQEELRAGTFNLDKTAQKIMEEGKEAIQGAEGTGSEAAAQAQEAAEKIAKGEPEPELAQRVKERVIGQLGETS